uniref:Uncharacterized protein n=1 Tax=Rhizophora mucronata TaxID=61149 RepID=A0A2P2NNV3_RHIMU
MSMEEPSHYHSGSCFIFHPNMLSRTDSANYFPIHVLDWNMELPVPTKASFAHGHQTFMGRSCSPR